MRIKTKNILIGVIILSVILFIIAYPKILNKYYIYVTNQENLETQEDIRSIQKENKKLNIERSQTQNNTYRSNSEIQNTYTIKEITKQLPSKAYIDVPFICQAPLQTQQNWTLHEESCEEAAVLQTYLFETNKTMSKPEANEEILKMISWEIDFFGSHQDLDADKMIRFISGYYKINEKNIILTRNASFEDIKLKISQNHPVIAPVTAKLLKNPYYPYPGYHMLQITGYTDNKIITNDNGTRKGSNFSYNKQTFMNAFNDAGAFIITIEL